MEASQFDSEGGAFDAWGQLLFSAEGVSDLVGGVVGEVAAVEVAGGQSLAPAGIEAGRDAIRRLVLVELSGRDVPGPCGVSCERSTTKGVDDVLGLFSSDGSAADAAVVAEPVVDIGELGLHGGTALVERLGSGDPPVDVVHVGGDRVDVAGVGRDLIWQLLGRSVGVVDLGVVTATAKRAVVFGKRLKR